jgi:chromosome segregation ATPase
VIQTALFFVLGFLSAAFIALLVAPAIWRRAVALTRKRVEASVPLSLDEIQADKDRMRAEFAMSTRRLEMSVKQFREKATQQIVEINRNREDLKRIVDERDAKDAAVAELEARAAELRTELKEREKDLQRTSERLAAQERLAEERAFEIDKLGRMYEESSFSASTRQIEMVAQESKLDDLSDSAAKLRGERKEADRRIRELVEETKALRQSLRAESKKSTGLESKIERLQKSLDEREEAMARQQGDVTRLREQLAEGKKTRGRADDEAAALRERCAALEGELAERVEELSRLMASANQGDVEAAMARVNADKTRLEERLNVLTKENKRLRGRLDTLEQSASEDWSEERRANSLLREQINDLAAEVVNMAALLDGSQSQIREALALEMSEGLGNPSVVSLADRVRALQKAAAEASG